MLDPQNVDLLDPISEVFELNPPHFGPLCDLKWTFWKIWGGALHPLPPGYRPALFFKISGLTLSKRYRIAQKGFASPGKNGFTMYFKKQQHQNDYARFGTCVEICALILYYICDKLM